MPQIVADNNEEIERDRRIAQGAVLSMIENLYRVQGIQWFKPVDPPASSGALFAGLPVVTSPHVPRDVAYMAEQRMAYQDPKSFVKIVFS